MKKLFFVLMLCTSISPSIFAQPTSFYNCNMIIVRPWNGYQPGPYEGGGGIFVSENAAIENWTNIFVSQGFPREIFNVACVVDGNYFPSNNQFSPGPTGF